MSKPSLVAIDGPVASGKSTVGKLVAEKLGFQFIDTGMMYRALTWLAIHLGISPDDEAALDRLAAETDISFLDRSTDEVIRIRHRASGRNSETQEFCLTPSSIFNSEIGSAVSQVSRVAGVRKVLVAQQQQLAEQGNVVMVGRDIGTTVLPHSGVKAFLTASLEERAQRRHLERSAGDNTKYDTILAELKMRDNIDSHRAISPLQPSSDAYIIDTEGLTVEQVATKILTLMDKPMNLRITGVQS